MKQQSLAAPQYAWELMSEAEVVRLACAGVPRAFEHLYKLHNQRVFGLCLRIVGSRTEAEDLTQEAFLQLFRKIQTFRGESSFSTWLHRLAANVALMSLRKKRRLEISLDATVDGDQQTSRPAIQLGRPDLRLNGVLDRVNLNKAIEQLPNGYKEVFLLHDVEGYEHKEVATILGCSVGNSKSQLFKARMRLRELVRDALRSQARQARRLAPNPASVQESREKVPVC